MKEIILCAQPSAYNPILSRSDLKKGVYKVTAMGLLAFTEIGNKIYKSSLRFDPNSTIRLVGGKWIGILINWDVKITNKNIEIMLISRQYYIPFTRTIKAIALKISIEGTNESVDEYLEILKTKFKTPPTNFNKWTKLEKEFKVQREEIEANWRYILNS